MAAHIVRLKTKPERMRSEQAAELRGVIAEFPGLPERAKSEIIAAIDRQTASQEHWPFVMLQPGQNEAVVRWLRRNSRFPIVAIELWAVLFTAMRRDTGEVAMTRDEIADRIGTNPDNVSQIMGELVEVNAVTTRRERVRGMRGPGRVVYSVNPNVGTHLAGRARDNAQHEAGALRLVTEPA